MSLPIEWKQRGCAVPTYWHNITSTTEKLVISWTLNLNQKKVTGWNKNEMEQIRAEQCGRACMARKPIAHGRYSCHRGSKGLKWWLIPMKAVKFFPAAKARGVSLSDFSEARHAAKSAIPSSLPCICRQPRAVQQPGGIPSSASCFPLRYLLQSWAQGWRLHPKRGECRIVHIQTSQLKARLQARVTESVCNKSTN